MRTFHIFVNKQFMSKYLENYFPADKLLFDYMNTPDRFETKRTTNKINQSIT